MSVTCRLNIFVVALAVLVGILVPAAAQSSDIYAPIAQALQQQEFERALDLVAPALQQFPDDPQLWAMQGAAYAGTKNTKEALASYNHALKIAPDYLPALHGAAQIAYDAGSAAAIPLIQRVLRLRPGDRTGHAMLAVLEYRRGNCAAAVEQFDRAGTLVDSQLPALHAEGLCLVKLQRLDRAATVFQRALDLQPEDAEERLLLASVQLMGHKPHDALVTLGPLLASGNAGTLDLASAAYEEVGDTGEALSALQKAIVADPQNVNLYLDFAHLCYAHNSFEAGINAVSDGIGLQPKAAPLYLARGVLYVQLGQYDKAEADFDKAHELDPRQSLNSAALGVAAAQENDFDRALKTVQTKLTRKPDDPLLLYLQADFLLQRGAAPGSPEFQLAMRSARRAVTLNPMLADARGVLAKLDLQSGQYADAIEQCKKALEYDPKNQAAVYHLIQALRKTGKTGDIPELLKRLAQLREEAARAESQRNRYKLVETAEEPGASRK